MTCPRQPIIGKKRGAGNDFNLDLDLIMQLKS
jgi:hypothetical protein